MIKFYKDIRWSPFLITVANLKIIFEVKHMKLKLTIALDLVVCPLNFLLQDCLILKIFKRTMLDNLDATSQRYIERLAIGIYNLLNLF